MKIGFNPKIENSADAKQLAVWCAKGFYFLAAIEIVMGVFYDLELVISGIFVAILATLLLKFQSRSASLLLLLQGLGTSFPIFLEKIFGTEDANEVFWFLIPLAIFVLWCSFMAVKSAYRYRKLRKLEGDPIKDTSICTVVIVLSIILLSAVVIFMGAKDAIFDEVDQEMHDQSKAYTDSIIPAIVANPNNPSMITDRMLPDRAREFDVNGFYNDLKKLGAYREYLGSDGKAIGIKIGAGNTRLYGDYSANVRFEKGDVVIKIRLFYRNDYWYISNVEIE